MKKLIKILTIPMVFGGALALAACQKPAEPVEKFEVAFETDGGTMYYTVRAEKGDSITLPTPEKEGYDFEGWFVSENYEGSALGESYLVEGDITLYAKWDAYDGTIKFESNGGTKYSDLSFYAQKVNIPTPEREGYLFAGWYDNETFSGEKIEGTILPKEDMTLYAKWEEIIGSVVFVSNGGTEYEVIHTAGQKVELPTPTKQDYIFAGWYDNKELQGKVYEGEILPEGTVTLFARWANTFNVVTLEENGGVEEKDIIHFDNDELNLPTPFRYGYGFRGWYEDVSFTGEPVSEHYRPVKDTTLYAKWEKITYVYMYYGENLDSVRLEYNEGDVIPVESLTELYTPNDLTVTDYLGREHFAPFMYWAYEGADEKSHIKVTSDITVGSEHIILVAQYDYSSVPANEHLTYDVDKDVYTTTGKVAHVFIEDAPTTPYSYSMDISFTKGIGGGVGPAFRMDLPGTNYQYESGCNYLCPGIIPADGSMQISSVYNGAWSRLVSSIPLASMPEEWQEKFNSTEANHKITLTMTIVDYGSSFEVYVDNKLALSYTNATTLAKYTGNDLGLRSSTTPAKLSNINLSTGYKVSFNTHTDGLTVKDTSWLVGDIELPMLSKENAALEGWYYDEELTQRVDNENFVIKQDTTLHAKWSSEYHVVSFNTNGGSASTNVNWVAGKLMFPADPTKMNYMFTGWYYDSACTREVDPYNFETSENTTLYAGWRLPYSHLTKNADGSYTYTKKTEAVLGTLESGIPAEGTYHEFNQTITMTKGAGSVGLAFRMNMNMDYTYETAGTDYLSIQFCSNFFRISYVTNGKWVRLLPNNADYAITKMPQSWQDKVNSTAEGAQMTVKLTVKDYGSYFEAYVDGELAYTYGQNGETVDLTKYTGNGYGVRCSAGTTVIFDDIEGKVVNK